MNKVFGILLGGFALFSSASLGNEIDGKILNCQCKTKSANGIDDLNATGNEKKIAFRKHFREFSISFTDGKAITFFPVEEKNADGIFITGHGIENARKYSTTLDHIRIHETSKGSIATHKTWINRKTLSYKEEIILKHDSVTLDWFSMVATCEVGQTMSVFKNRSQYEETYKKIKSENKI
tara:strand:+ start:1007 stop:1546 length:540 start_codon:yes stop_codon:yes gene_type:complete